MGLVEPSLARCSSSKSLLETRKESIGWLNVTTKVVGDDVSTAEFAGVVETTESDWLEGGVLTC
jgi:hypothetical protein